MGKTHSRDTLKQSECCNYFLLAELQRESQDTYTTHIYRDSFILND